eukprot:TRINITY_DN4125_c0_g1_i2.p1 TRINITY_DN4125_c0_g1~~TRINITY_DN4125_c0_g1_i2.p1  ORF type:complete len:414 (-),score=71.29 TRINITY_DN4125_c0_g1_i2:125-1366(-)
MEGEKNPGAAAGVTALMRHASEDDPEELFELMDVVGHGAFGTVCSCLNKSSSSMVAVKFIPIESEDVRKLQKEIDIMKSISRAPEIVQYHGCYVKDEMLLIVMEYCDGGSVMDILRACKRTLTEEQASAVCAAVVLGLQHLHKVVRIMHRDIKAANVLLNSKGEAKLADFGVSAQLATSAQKQKTVIGSPYWMAPEVIDQADSDTAVGYNSKSDIWSLGITCMECCEGKPPHYELQPIRAILKIPQEPPPTLTKPEKWTNDIRDFLRVCLQKTPDDRPDAVDLLEHPFIEKGLLLYRRAILAELVEQSMPALTKARAEQQEGDTDDGDDDGSSRDSDDDDDDDSRSNSWFNLQKGSTLALNKGTMKATIRDQQGKEVENKSNNSSKKQRGGRGDDDSSDGEYSDDDESKGPAG